MKDDACFFQLSHLGIITTARHVSKEVAMLPTSKTEMYYTRGYEPGMNHLQFCNEGPRRLLWAADQRTVIRSIYRYRTSATAGPSDLPMSLVW